MSKTPQQKKRRITDAQTINVQIIAKRRRGKRDELRQIEKNRFAAKFNVAKGVFLQRVKKNSTRLAFHRETNRSLVRRFSFHRGILKPQNRSTMVLVRRQGQILTGTDNSINLLNCQMFIRHQM